MNEDILSQMQNDDILSEMHNINEIILKSETLPVAKERDENGFMQAVDSISTEVADKIQDCSLITTKDISELKKAQAFLFQTYTDVRQYRPLINKLTTVMSNSRFPTPDSKFWQAKAEAEVHFNELQRETFKWQRAKIDLNELDYKIESIERMLETEDETKKLTPFDKYDPNLVKFDLQRLCVKRSQYEFEMKQLEKSIKYRIEEITDWSKVAESFELTCNYNTRDPDEHLAETKIMLLNYQIENCEDKEMKIKLTEQLKLLISMVVPKKEKGSE